MTWPFSKCPMGSRLPAAPRGAQHPANLASERASKRLHVAHFARSIGKRLGMGHSAPNSETRRQADGKLKL